MENVIIEDKKMKSWSLLLTLSMIWGMSFLFIKRGLVGLEWIQVASLRMVAPGICFLPFIILQSKKIPPKKYWIGVFITAMAGMFIPAYLFSLAGTSLDSSVSGILNALAPIFTFIIGLFLFSHKTTTRQIIGLSLGFVGCFILMFRPEKLSVNPYALLIMMATSLYGFNVNYVKKYLSELSSMSLLFGIVIINGILGIIILLGTDFFTTKIFIRESQVSIGYVLILGGLGSGVASLLFYDLLQISSTLFASSVTYLIPIFALILGFLDGEKIVWQHFLGMGVVFFGVYLITTKVKKNNPILN